MFYHAQIIALTSTCREILIFMLLPHKPSSVCVLVRSPDDPQFLFCNLKLFSLPIKEADFSPYTDHPPPFFSLAAVPGDYRSSLLLLPTNLAQGAAQYIKRAVD